VPARKPEGRVEPAIMKIYVSPPKTDRLIGLCKLTSSYNVKAYMTDMNLIILAQVQGESWYNLGPKCKIRHVSIISTPPLNG